MKSITIKRANQIMDQNGGNLDLHYTDIAALPDNLTVGGGLYLTGTAITTLPDSLNVGGEIYGLQRNEDEEPERGAKMNEKQP